MTHVCVGKKKSVGGWDEKIVEQKKSFWGRVHTCWRKDGEHVLFMCVCVSHRDTVWLFLLIQQEVFKVFLVFFPRFFFLFLVCLNPYLFFGSGFCWIRGPSNTARKAERLAHTHTHTHKVTSLEWVMRLRMSLSVFSWIWLFSKDFFHIDGKETIKMPTSSSEMTTSSKMPKFSYTHSRGVIKKATRPKSTSLPWDFPFLFACLYKDFFFFF